MTIVSQFYNILSFFSPNIYIKFFITCTINCNYKIPATLCTLHTRSV